MKKDLYMKSPSEKIVIQSDDLKYDGKNIVIPSYYDSVIFDYLDRVDVKDMNDADYQDYLAFRRFFEDIINYKADKGGN